MNNIFRYRNMIWTMAMHHVLERNAGTLGGIIWEVVHPLSMVLIFWFVFAIGFNAKGPSDMPFILYFIAGMLPWITFAGVFNSGANCVVANSHLVKKTVFPTEVLPFVHILAALLPHLILLLILILVMLCYGWNFSLAILQLPYYFVGMTQLLLGLSWLTSALNVFSRDVGQFVRIVTEIWFWLTPVVWVVDMVPENFRWIIMVNPMSFVVQGYRDSLLFHGYLWDDGWPLFCFWFEVMLIFSTGVYVFKRLKNEFADVI